MRVPSGTADFFAIPEKSLTRCEALARQLGGDGRPLDNIAAPAAGAREAVAAEHAARAGDDEAKRELRDRRRVAVAGVRDENSVVTTESLSGVEQLPVLST